MFEGAPYALEEHDDLRHALVEDPTSGESIATTIVLPDHERFLVVHGRVEPNDQASRMLALFGPDGLEHFDVARGEFTGDDFHDATFAGLHLTQPERSRTMGLAFTGEEMSLRCAFDGVHPAFGFGANADGCCPVVATDRSEQAGTVRGSLTVGGRELAFDTMGHRDHSWGPRDYRALFHWKWISLQAGPAVAVHAMEAWYQGRVWVNGYVFRDGELSPLRALRTRIAFDDRVVQQRAELWLTDERGRETFVEAERIAGGTMEIPGVTVAEAGCRCEIDGRPGDGSVELGWQSAYHEHLRTTRHEPVV